MASAQADKIHVWNRMCTAHDAAILFSNSYNEIRMYGEGISPADLVVTYINGQPCYPQIDADTLVFTNISTTINNQLLIKHKRDNRIQKIVSLTTRPAVKFTARLGYLAKDVAPKELIFMQEKVRVICSDPLFSPNTIIQVNSFTFTANSGNGPTTIKGYGNTITDDMRIQINNLQSGTAISISDILLVGPNLKMKLPDIRVTAK